MYKYLFRNQPTFSFAFHGMKDILATSAIEFEKTEHGTIMSLRQPMYRNSEAAIIRATNLIKREYEAANVIPLNILLKFCRHVCLHSTPKTHNRVNRDYDFNIEVLNLFLIFTSLNP